MNESEKLGFHTEVLALKEKFGISYKDAAHRLYMTELEKLKVNDTSYKTYMNLKTRIENTLKKSPAQLSAQPEDEGEQGGP